MNSLAITIAGFGCFFLGYFFYARFVQKRLDINPEEKTPAFTQYDGVDFIPAKNWLILFGHHFSSIAGAAPIVGPVIAVSIWGWGPTLLWIILGSIFLGGLHDFSSLVISVKNKGRSIAEIAGETISIRAKYIFSVFVFFALILVVAVFAYLCAKTLVTDTRVIIPSLGLIPVAMLVGVLIYKLKTNQVVATITGLTLLVALIIAGYLFPLNLEKNSLNFWLIVLLAYAFIASITPVNILLQPRDYLSAYLLFFGIAVGFLSIIVSHPRINAPLLHFSRTNPSSLWPMLFVTVACGAISGFHCLIASGTTSKQLPSQKFAKRIGYGAMILEGILAFLALLCVSAGIESFSAFKEIMKTSGPIVAFSKGFGEITKPLLKNLGPITGVIILNAFILTTLDTATRITRYIFEEITKIRNRLISTACIIILAGYLSWGGKWRTIWPTFGASNQLVAALALFVITSWLLAKSKPFTLVLLAAIFMLTTTVFALYIQSLKYFRETQYILLLISIVLIILALFIFAEVINILRKKLIKDEK